MNNFSRWAVIAGALLLAAVVGGAAYNAGVAHGIAESGKVIAAPAAPGAYPYPYPYPYHGWHRPWGFGLFFFPLVFIAFWFLVARLFWRGGGWRRGGACGAAGRFDEWHRQAHERMWNDPARGEGAPAER